MNRVLPCRELPRTPRRGSIQYIGLLTGGALAVGYAKAQVWYEWHKDGSVTEWARARRVNQYQAYYCWYERHIRPDGSGTCWSSWGRSDWIGDRPWGTAEPIDYMIPA